MGNRKSGLAGAERRVANKANTLEQNKYVFAVKTCLLVSK